MSAKLTVDFFWPSQQKRKLDVDEFHWLCWKPQYDYNTVVMLRLRRPFKASKYINLAR